MLTQTIPLLRSWFRSPRRAALLASAYAVTLWLASRQLGIDATATHGGYPYDGFLSQLWIAVMALSVAAAYLTPVLVAQGKKAVRSLNRILHRIEPTSRPVISTELLRGWSQRAALAFLLASIFTFYADWRDILSPLDLFATSGDRDWSTAYVLGRHPPLLYLLFNIMAFGAQAFCIGAGFTILLFFFPVFRVLVADTLESRRDRILRHYSLRWDFTDATGRCGLAEWDKLFVLLTTLLTAALFVALYFNVERTETVDPGIILLALLIVLKTLVAIVYLLIPVWSHFPRELPQDISEQGLLSTRPVYSPVPWPALPISGAVVAALPDVANVLRVVDALRGTDSSG